MSELPKHLEKSEEPDEVGGDHGDVTGAWRIVRNGTALAAVAMLLAYLIFI